MLEPDILNLGFRSCLVEGGVGVPLARCGEAVWVWVWGLARAWSPHQVVNGGERVVGMQ